MLFKNLNFQMFLLLLSSIHLFATPQFMENIFYQGKALKMQSTPLESYYTTNNRPTLFKAYNTANWRGYIGEWIVRNDSLFLRSVTIEEDFIDTNSVENPKGGIHFNGMKIVKKNVIDLLFLTSKKPVFANWVNDNLTIVEGKLIDYVHMGYGSTYEKEYLLKIENGIVTKEVTIFNDDSTNAFNSRFNQGWVAISDGIVINDTSWTDFRELMFGVSLPIKTRAVIEIYGKVIEVTIPGSKKTLPIYGIAKIDKRYDDLISGPVEFVLKKSIKNEYGFEFEIDDIRQLKPGESIHRSEFNKSTVKN